MPVQRFYPGESTPTQTGTTQFSTPDQLGALLGQVGGRGISTQPTAGPFSYPPMYHVQMQSGGAVQNAGMMADLLAKYGPMVAGQMFNDINALGEGGSLGGGTPGAPGPGTSLGPWVEPTPAPQMQTPTSPPLVNPRAPVNDRRPGGTPAPVAPTSQPTTQAAAPAETMNFGPLMALGQLLSGMQQQQQQPQMSQVPSINLGEQAPTQSSFGLNFMPQRPPQGLRRRPF